jgi:hypothetical protein
MCTASPRGTSSYDSTSFTGGVPLVEHNIALLNTSNSQQPRRPEHVKRLVERARISRWLMAVSDHDAVSLTDSDFKNGCVVSLEGQDPSTAGSCGISSPHINDDFSEVGELDLLMEVVVGEAHSGRDYANAQSFLSVVQRAPTLR